MRPLAKVGLIVAGYVVACVVAVAAVAIHVAATSSDRQGADGMYAFGDDLLFLAVFGVAAIPSTAAALLFLRSYRSFWSVLCVVALCIATTGFAALIVYVATRAGAAGSALHTWSALAVLRILIAPLFALVFLLSGLFAPNRTARFALLIATVVEAAVFASAAFILLQPFSSH